MPTRQFYLNSTLAVVAFLTALYAAIAVLWALKVLEKHLFSVSRVGVITQTIVVVVNVLSGTILPGISFLLQALATDHILRRR